MFDAFGFDWDSLPKTPSAIRFFSTVCGGLLGAAGCWFGAEGFEPVALKALIATGGGVAGLGLGFLAGIILAVAFIGGVIGLVVGIAAIACGHFFFENDSFLLVVVPTAAGAGIGALVGLGQLLDAAFKRPTARSVLAAVGFLALLAPSVYFFIGGVENQRRHARERREQEAAQAEQDRRAVRDRLEAAAAEAVPLPDALAANAEGKRAYEAWHRAARLLREHRALGPAIDSSAASQEKEVFTAEKLGKLAALSDEPDVKNLLVSIQEALVVARREAKEADEKSVTVRGGEVVDINMMPGFQANADRDAREKRLQDGADECMARLTLRYGVDFARMPVWVRATPARGSEAESLAGRLAGSWEGNFVVGRASVSGVETYWPDGRFLFTGTVTRDGRPSAVSDRGTWRIEGKKLHVRIIPAGGTAAPPANADGDEIVTLTEDEKTTRNRSGEVKTLRKVGK